MNEIARIPLPDLFGDEGRKTDVFADLFALARHVRLDPATGNLTLHNGDARIVLTADGTVRVEGRRIVQTARENFAVVAATIDLN